MNIYYLKKGRKLNKNTVLLITGTININSSHVKIVDPKKREIEYLKSFLEYLVVKDIKNIVFCENSQSDLLSVSLTEIGNKLGINIEILTFKGNTSAIKKLGKGYGEGEIIEHALNNSKLLIKADNFFKITGRLTLKNFNKILSSMDFNKNYFTKLRNNRVDTRFYFVQKNFYQNNLLKGYTNVNDDKLIYLEHVFFNIICRNKFEDVTSFKYYPIMLGYSGSTGESYVESNIKLILKSILNKFGFFKCKGFK